MNKFNLICTIICEREKSQICTTALIYCHLDVLSPISGISNSPCSIDCVSIRGCSEQYHSYDNRRAGNTFPHPHLILQLTSDFLLSCRMLSRTWRVTDLAAFLNVFGWFVYFWLSWASAAARAFSDSSKQGLLSSCSAQPSPCGSFPCRGPWALGLVGFSSCGLGVSIPNPRDLDHRISSRGARHSLPQVMWIYPDQASNLSPLYWHVDSSPRHHQGSSQQLFKQHVHIIETWFKMSLYFYFPAMKLISPGQNQFTIPNLVFLHDYVGPGNLLNTILIDMFSLPLSLGYDRAHGLVCWCEDILPAGKCRQWPPSGELRPHLKGRPSSLHCPAA